jgi:hypothetical protein
LGVRVFGFLFNEHWLLDATIRQWEIRLLLKLRVSRSAERRLWTPLSRQAPILATSPAQQGGQFFVKNKQKTNIKPSGAKNKQLSLL